MISANTDTEGGKKVPRGVKIPLKFCGRRYAERSGGPKPVATALSMFCGCGGLDLGFIGGFRYRGALYKRHPVKLLKAIDNDPRCVATYKINIGEHAEVGDLGVMKPSELPAADILLGGFPCQDFSWCGPRAGLNSKRGALYRALVEYMRHHQPMIAVGENVPNMVQMEDGKVWEKIKADLEGAGYRCKLWKLHAADYGVPQNRERLILMCVRNDVEGEPSMPVGNKDARPSIEWAIGDLVDVAGDKMPNHDQYFRAGLARKGHGQGDEVSIRDEPALTIRANAKSRIQFHYELKRRLTMRECARIQSFPDRFIFPHAATQNVKEIGNAVPPVFAHVVADSVFVFLEEVSRKKQIQKTNERQRL